MFPILVEFGDFILPAWHTFFAIAAVSAAISLRILRKVFNSELSDVFMSRLFVVCYVSGYFGARVTSILIEQSDFDGIGGFFKLLFSLGPLTFYGGAFGAAICGILYAKRNRVSLWKLLDLTVPSSALALCLGRIGCFLNGDDYGKPVPIDSQDAWWAVQFPNLNDQISRYPVQLYEAFFALLLFLGLIYLLQKFNNNRRVGATGLLGIFLYAVFRFFIEFYRGDFRGYILVESLSTSQFISLMLVLVLGTYIIFSQLKARKGHT